MRAVELEFSMRLWLTPVKLHPVISLSLWLRVSSSEYLKLWVSVSKILCCSQMQLLLLLHMTNIGLPQTYHSLTHDFTVGYVVFVMVSVSTVYTALLSCHHSALCFTIVCTLANKLMTMMIYLHLHCRHYWRCISIQNCFLGLPPCILMAFHNAEQRYYECSNKVTVNVMACQYNRCHLHQTYEASAIASGQHYSNAAENVSDFMQSGLGLLAKVLKLKCIYLATLNIHIYT